MNKQYIATYEQAVEYINSTPRFTTKHTMEDTKAFLAKLGHPDRDLKIIHVAGTNGKGSVCAYMRSILETAGYRVAVFTSPHLTDIRERFVADGRMMDREEFLHCFLDVYERLDWEALSRGQGYHPSFFEYLFFMGMLWFAGKKPDYCILETGLGGRLDATNSVEHKLLAVITRIGLDHVEYLGDTPAAIAGEKAGIMQPGVPAVCLNGDLESADVFRQKAKELGVPLQELSSADYSFLNFKNKTIDFSYLSRYYGNISLTLHTSARYQMENCALAVRALEAVFTEAPFAREILQKGVEDCVWEGRMEEVLPEVYVDGAHNEDGIRAFLESVREDGHTGTRVLLFSAVKDKNYAAMLGEIAGSGLFTRVAIPQLESQRAASLEEMDRVLRSDASLKWKLYASVREALTQELRVRKETERLYIAGSLYLVGEIKEYIGNDQF